MIEKSPVGKPVTLGELIAGICGEFLQWDRGLAGTLIAMTFKPAEVARAYIQNRDPRYTRPWRYLVFSLIINVALTWFVLDKLGLRERLSLGAEGGAELEFIFDNAALSVAHRGE